MLKGTYIQAGKEATKGVHHLDLPSERYHMKHLIAKLFSDLTAEGKLALKVSERNNLIDFLGTFPEIVTRAATRDNIVPEFISTGMTDSKFNQYLGFNKILSISPLEKYNKRTYLLYFTMYGTYTYSKDFVRFRFDSYISKLS